MLLTTYIVFGLGISLEICAGILALVLPLRGGRAQEMHLPQGMAGAGAALLGVMLVLRGLHFGQVPLSSGVEFLTLVVVMLAVTVTPPAPASRWA